MRAADPTAETLTPKLTAWDRRVLSKLAPLPERFTEPADWKDAWEIARELRADDVADVRRTLDGLCKLPLRDGEGLGPQPALARPSRPNLSRGKRMTVLSSMTRAQLEEACQAFNWKTGELEARVAELEAALREIAEWPTPIAPTLSGIARAALTPKGEQHG